MRKKVVIDGVVVIIIGLVIWFAGAYVYYNGLHQKNLYEEYINPIVILENVNTGIFDSQIQVGAIFTLTGFFLFLTGFVVLIIGFIFKENVLKPVDKPKRVCPNCGREIPFDAVICPYCGHKF